MPIRKLPALLINQIAAGEVIERPASVVKELIENSLDAGVTRIAVTVEEGGRQLIRVSDDGAGITEAELPLAVAAHATSKLQKVTQLNAIETLGFRGEALASIASVSRLSICTRATTAKRTAESGAMIEASGDQVNGPMPWSGAPGTVIEVRDLFFNIPARRKFLRGAATEFGHISDIVARIAMVHADKSFKLLHNKRTAIDVTAAEGVAARRQRCVQILGKELNKALLEFEHLEPSTPDGAVVWGLAGLPAIARATTRFQYVSVNGRPVRDRHIGHAIKEAYRGLIPPDKHPQVVLAIQLDSAAVDVNVHPTKAEVRFREPNRVHGLVLTAIRQRLLGADLTPGVQLPVAGGRLPLEDLSSAAIGNRQSQVTDSPSAFVDYFRSMDSTQKGFVYQEVKKALAEERPELLQELTEPKLPATTPRPSRCPGVLQVHKSYLVTQDEQGILIIDQHALHERVMFEELARRVLSSDLESQRLLMPAVLEASANRLSLLDQLGPLLKRIGIEARRFGEQELAVHAFPTFLFDRKIDPAEFLDELLDRATEGQIDPGDLGDGSTASEAALHKVLDMMSCKAAVKAGDHLSEAELEALLARRSEIERSSNCPHGRPTTIRLTLRDLEKQFKRT